MKLQWFNRRQQRSRREQAASPKRWPQVAARFLHAGNVAVAGFKSLFLFMAGSHPQEVERLPAAEVRAMRVEGAMLLLSGFIILLATAAASVIAGVPVWATPIVVVPVVTLIMLLDRTILGGLNLSDGEELAKRANVRGYFPLGRGRRQGLIFARILFSLATMAFVTLLARTVIFGVDIERHIARQDTIINAKVRSRAEELMDRQIADAQQALDQTVKERNEVRGLISRTDQPVDTASIDTQVAAEQKVITAAKADFAGLVRSYQEHKRAASAEASGVQDKSGDSGIQGQGSRYQYHMRQMASIRVQAAALRESAARAQARIVQLEAQRGQEKATYAQQAEVGRNALNPRLADADKAVAAMAARRSAIVAKRASSVQAMIESDPAYVPASRGLIARVEALDTIQNHSISSIVLSVSLTLMFSILELSAILVRLIQGAPHVVGAEKVNLSVNAVDEIYGPHRTKARRGRSRAANDVWVSFNDNPENKSDEDAA